MTTRAQSIMAQLLGRALDVGEVQLRGDKIYRGSEQVMPRLSFERASSTTTTVHPGHGIRLSAGERETESEDRMTYRTYAGLPESRLVPSDQAAADRARMAEERHQRVAADLHRSRERAAERAEWPKGAAPLPADRLTRSERR